MPSGSMMKYLRASSGPPARTARRRARASATPCRRAAGAVQQHHRIGDVAGGVALRRAEPIGLRARPGQGLLQEARPDAGAALHPGQRRDLAIGDLQQRRYRHRARHPCAARRLSQGRADPRHRRLVHQRRRAVLLRARRLADQDHEGRRRQVDRDLDQRLGLQHVRAAPGAAFRRRPEAAAGRQLHRDVDAGADQAARHRVFGGAVQSQLTSTRAASASSRAAATCRRCAT